MPVIDLKTLTFIRGIPLIGARVYEAFHAVQQGMNAMAIQGNLNPTGHVDPPPSIDGVTATADNGVLHVSIQHTASEVRRDVMYHVEHADNPNFTNPQIRHLGDSRSFSEFIGSQERYVQAYASYGASAAGAVLVHGGAATPQPVSGGGSIGPAPYLPSQGRSTGAAGQGGVHSSPVPIRTDVSGFDWRLQRPIASEAISRASSPGSENGIGSPSGGGGGGGGGVTVSESLISAAETLASVGGTGNAITGATSPAYSSLAADFVIRYVPIHDNSGAVTLNVNSIGAKSVTKNGSVALVGGELVTGRAYLLVYDGTRFELIGQISPISATVLASDSHGVSSVASLTDSHVWIGNGSNLPVDKAISQDASLANTGALTVTGANGLAIPISQVIVGTNGSGQFVAGLTTPACTPVLSFGGASTGITYAIQSATCIQIGHLIQVWINISLTNKGSSTGTVSISGLPSTVGVWSGAAFGFITGMALVTGAPIAYAPSGGTSLSIWQMSGGTGMAQLTDANFTNGSQIILSMAYYA